MLYQCHIMSCHSHVDIKFLVPYVNYFRRSCFYKYALLGFSPCTSFICTKEKEEEGEEGGLCRLLYFGLLDLLGSYVEANCLLSRTTLVI